MDANRGRPSSEVVDPVPTTDLCGASSAYREASDATFGTVYIAAMTTAERYAELTGLREDCGFVMWEGYPSGIYLQGMAQRITQELTRAGIGHHITPAHTVNEGRRKVSAA